MFGSPNIPCADPDAEPTEAEVERAAADYDLRAYAHNMAMGNDRCCLAIEEAWGLAGLPPEIVSCVLAGVSEGASFDDAFARWTR